MDFFKKIKERQQEAKNQEQGRRIASSVEKRWRAKTVPATEEPKPSSPGASAREYYEHCLTLKNGEELYFVGLWLIGEFYYTNKGMGVEYVQKAITVYQQLIRAYFTLAHGKVKKPELLNEYYNADEAQMRISNLYCLDLDQPDKALPYFGNFKESFPTSKYCEYCQEQFKIIKENSGERAALKIFLRADFDHGHQRYTQARAGFEEVVGKHTETKLALLAKLRLGDILFFQEKDIKAAAAIYEQALERWGVNDFTSRALYQLGDCYREQEEWLKAIDYYGQYIMDSGTKFRIDFAKYYMAVCHEYLGNWDGAQSAYEGVLAMPKSYWQDKSRKRVEEIKTARERGILDMLSETLRVRSKKK